MTFKRTLGYENSLLVLIDLLNVCMISKQDAYYKTVITFLKVNPCGKLNSVFIISESTSLNIVNWILCG